MVKLSGFKREVGKQRECGARSQERKVRITVLKLSKPGDLWGRDLPGVTSVKDACSAFAVGQQFVVDEYGHCPEGFCPHAWYDVWPWIMHLRFGGDFPWMLEKGTAVVCCTDGFRPVIFKLERIEE